MAQSFNSSCDSDLHDSKVFYLLLYRTLWVRLSVLLFSALSLMYRVSHERRPIDKSWKYFINRYFPLFYLSFNHWVDKEYFAVLRNECLFWGTLYVIKIFPNPFFDPLLYNYDVFIKQVNWGVGLWRLLTLYLISAPSKSFIYSWLTPGRS